MKIFITGVAGFLGSHLADALIKKKINVIGIDNLRGGYKDNIPEKVKFYKIDCNDFKKVNKIIFTGGGRKNKYLISQIKKLNHQLQISLIDDYGLNGDLIESQMFGYIGIRSLKKLILSTPNTTGVKKNITGGNLYY